MLSIQAYRMGIDQAYDRYQHIFLGLALWYLQFNYLKMVKGVFYFEGSAFEQLTL